LPGSVMSNAAFQNAGITSLTMGEGFTMGGQGIFDGNSINTENEPLVLPLSIERIVQQTFRGNPLTWITIGAGVEIVDGVSAMGNNHASFLAAYIANDRLAGTYRLMSVAPDVWYFNGNPIAP